MDLQAVDEEIKFQCSSCGLCCKSVGKLTKAQKMNLDFPYDSKEDGSCEKLDENGQCSIYETRPDICSVERTYEKFHKSKGRTKKDVFLSENKICNTLIEKAGLDKKYLIDLTLYDKYQ